MHGWKNALKPSLRHSAVASPPPPTTRIAHANLSTSQNGSRQVDPVTAACSASYSGMRPYSSSSSSSSSSGRGRGRGRRPTSLASSASTSYMSLAPSISQQEIDLLLRRFLDTPSTGSSSNTASSSKSVAAMFQDAHYEVLADAPNAGGSNPGSQSPVSGGGSGNEGNEGDGKDGKQQPPPAKKEDDGIEKDKDKDDSESQVDKESVASDETIVDTVGAASAPGGQSSGGKGGGRSRPLNREDGTANNSNSLEKITVPKDYPQLLAIPLTRRPLFPGFYKSLYIKDPNVISAIQSLMDRRQPYVGIFLTRDDDSELDTITDLDQVHKVGVFAQITNVYHAGPDSSALTVVVYPHRRIRLTEMLPHPSGVSEAKVVDADAPTVITSTGGEAGAKTGVYHQINEHLGQHPVSVVNVENQVDQPYNHENPLIKAITSEMLNVLKEISQINPLLRDQIITFSIQTGGNAFADPARLADFAAAVSAGEPEELQSVLESLVIEERLHKALVVLKKELANAKLQQEIAKEVDKKITRKQQEYFLMEQLKGIKKELGMDSDGKDKLVEKFKERSLKLKMPEAVKKVFDEFNVTRNYLDWLTQIPWGKRSEENFDIPHATTVLDQDHYGLKDVKDRILEFIAVGKLRGTVEGKIICLVGPPGVGKTSVGKSIARALSREFFRFSVGGLTDVAEIKGHRRTYVGAMPGKVIQALKKVQTENPLIMIDEIDKIGRGHQGDPASALLELLDPEQNNSFLDHYMDVPIDLSKVLFVCTANTLETIPAPLLDRMEVITLSGYVAEEKVAIAMKYLSPTARSAAGLDKRNVTLTEDAIEALIRQYCRESGVRNLKKHIDKVFRKAALKIVKAESPVAAVAAGITKEETASTTTTAELAKADSAATAPVASVESATAPVVTDSQVELNISKDNLKEYVGSPVYTSDRMYDTTPPGVIMGLAWTAMGGSALYIESVLESAISDQSKAQFHRTGQMGDVMKESSTIAYTYAKSFITKYFPDNKFFEKAHIHMHVPEGATPKDGPSAGTTMTTSLLSLAMDKPAIPNVAMTGELTLTGKVLKIGGVKEKTIAAKRSGVTKIIFPLSNKSDWDELPDYVKEGLEPHFVAWYHEIFDIVFEGEKRAG
ncbi:ATP-dependent Lon protease pim1 [Blyttiomyces sp. JEL0837]|nr:ATP-dependent Lon protease pim1 [Blyttiomyces sp. JEL0837]